MIHELKTWPEHFKEVIEGKKTFEVRKNDRNFQVGDSLTLLEFDQSEINYTERWHVVEVTHILQGGQFGIEEGYCVMSIK